MNEKESSGADQPRGSDSERDSSAGAGNGKGNRTTPPANGWNVILELVRLMTWLLQTGNIIGLLISAVIIWVFFATFRASTSTIDRILLSALSFFENERFYIVPLSSALIFTIVVCSLYIRQLKTEIKRLTEIRRTLIHGIKDGVLAPYEKHNSSGFNLER